MQSSLEQIIQQHLQLCLDSFSHPADPDLLEHLEEALRFRFSGTNPEEIKHIYLKEYEIPQIVLFDILANRFPLVLNGQKAVQQVLLNNTKEAENITIIDLGIGRGLQIGRILQALVEKGSVKSVCIIGVEIMKEALEFTTQQLEKLRTSLPFEFEFHPIHSSFEQLDWNLIQEKLVGPYDFLMVNASLALHHIQEEKERIRVFKECRKLNPNLFTLIEPNVNNYTNNFNQRLLNSYEHFSALFAFIRQLELTESEKKGLKQFFSHEFYDNIALPDSHRFEKHQRAEQWLELSAGAGFKPLEKAFENLELSISGIQIDNSTKPYLNFSYPPSDILAIMTLRLN